MVKLFKNVSLDLELVTGTDNHFKLVQPKGGISKKSIFSELADTLALPTHVIDYLPNLITLQALEYNRNAAPAEVLLSLQVDFSNLFHPFPDIIALEQSTLDIRTTANIIEPAEEQLP